MSLPSSGNTELYLLAQNTNSDILIAISKTGSGTFTVVVAEPGQHGQFKAEPTVRTVDDETILDTVIREIVQDRCAGRKLLICKLVALGSSEYRWQVTGARARGKVSEPFRFVVTSAAAA